VNYGAPISFTSSLFSSGFAVFTAENCVNAVELCVRKYRFKVALGLFQRDENHGDASLSVFPHAIGSVLFFVVTRF
jgi:hypothetical protein